MIQRLFKEGKSFSIFPLRVVYIETGNSDHRLQAGFTVSSRNFKKAVDRNRIKRLMRESYRLQKNDIKISLLKNKKAIAVFFVYTGNEMPEYSDIFGKTGTALKKLEILFK